MIPLLRVLLVAMLTALAPRGAGARAFCEHGSVGVMQALVRCEALGTGRSVDRSCPRAQRPMVLANAIRHPAPIAGRSVGAAALAHASAKPARPSFPPPPHTSRRRLHSNDEDDTPSG